MIYYFDPHSPDRFTQLLLPSSLKRRVEDARSMEEVTRGTREDKSIVESIVCSVGNRNAFPLRAIGRDDTPQNWPTLLIHRASFSRGSFIINSPCHCLFDIRANSRREKKLMRSLRLGDMHECIVSTTERKIYCRHRTVSPLRVGPTKPPECINHGAARRRRAC